MAKTLAVRLSVSVPVGIRPKPGNRGAGPAVSSRPMRRGGHRALLGYGSAAVSVT
jgi:hypothetical protein